MTGAFIKKMRNDEYKQKTSSRTFVYGEKFFERYEEVNRIFLSA